MKDQIKAISAVTLATTDMERAVVFYESIGLELHRGGPTARFSTFAIGMQHINLRQCERHENDAVGSCLIIFRVEDVDMVFQQVSQLGYKPEFSPRDAEWGERYFHLHDPDGNRLSFAQLL